MNETCDRRGPASDRAEQTVMDPTSLRRVPRARLRARVILLPLLATLTVLMSACAAQGKPLQAAAGLAASPGFGSALVGSAPAGNGPSELALDPATHTIYVANGNNANGPNAGGNTVSVIDERHCQALDVSRCPGPWPTITVGNLPSTIAIDQHTDTVYVTDSGGNAVSVFNGEHPGTVSVINGASCNGPDHAGCGQAPASVAAGFGSVGVAIDPATGTVYVANIQDASVSVIDGAACNGSGTAGCSQAPPKLAVGDYPSALAVDPPVGTAYVASGTENTVSVIPLTG